MGDRRDAGEKSSTATSDGRKLGDAENSYTISIAPMSSELDTSREVSRGTSEAVELLPVSAMAFSLIDLCSFSGRASNTFL